MIINKEFSSQVMDRGMEIKKLRREVVVPPLLKEKAMKIFKNKAINILLVAFWTIYFIIIALAIVFAL